MGGSPSNTSIRALSIVLQARDYRRRFSACDGRVFHRMFAISSVFKP